MQFKSVKHTFSGMSPFRQSIHCFVALGVFVQTNRHIGRIRMLEPVAVLSVAFENLLDDEDR